MSALVFYCFHCNKGFAGEAYHKDDQPLCPHCQRKTVSTGVAREEWAKLSKEEREDALRSARTMFEAINQQAAQQQQDEARREAYATSVGIDYNETKESGFLDGLYANIGAKIKGWAMWIFILEAIGFVLTGIVMLIGENAAGLLFLFGGPFVAWVSSWMLYAFGELVEKTVENEKNTRAILKLMVENYSGNKE